jgi:hypothetical protein
MWYCTGVVKPINWAKVRRVVLNDRLVCYKPDKESLKKLSSRLPDANVIGFGIYSKVLFVTTWFLLVESSFFPEDDQPGFITMSISAIPIYKKTQLYLVPIINPGDSSA